VVFPLTIKFPPTFTFLPIAAPPAKTMLPVAMEDESRTLELVMVPEMFIELLKVTVPFKVVVPEMLTLPPM
jgi:hypothetical protein